ncbi:hypothetical protein [Actinomadura sp. 9N407]|uniref:hypothetical protein n=1 Tax=Actinomadura sp. 9N407 TaxID=3375154 RepID=UPI00379C03DE
MEAIGSVDWASIAGRPDWYDPECAAAGMRELAAATSNLAAAVAATRLRGHGILHDHSGAVFPAAAVAAPLLLDIVERGHPAAKNAAVVLLNDALDFEPFSGYTRIDVPSARAVPLCCAIAECVRARRDLLTGYGKEGRSLLERTAEHWCFAIRELVIDDTDTIAFGFLDGTFPDGHHPAELHDAHRIIPLLEVTLEYPLDDGSAEACLRLVGVPPDHVRTNTLLYSAECGARVH